MRLNIERQNELEPKRMRFAKEQISNLNLTITYADDKKIIFLFKLAPVTLFVYSGWFTGKTVNDGRGIENLLKQLTT